MNVIISGGSCYPRVGETLRHLEEGSPGTETRASEPELVSPRSSAKKLVLQMLEKLQQLLSQDRTVTAGVKRSRRGGAQRKQNGPGDRRKPMGGSNVLFRLAAPFWLRLLAE